MPKTQNVMGFSGSVNGTTKNPGFWILVFANVNGPLVLFLQADILTFMYAYKKNEMCGVMAALYL